jgi:hypothetical protein
MTCKHYLMLNRPLNENKRIMNYNEKISLKNKNVEINSLLELTVKAYQTNPR